VWRRGRSSKLPSRDGNTEPGLPTIDKADLSDTVSDKSEHKPQQDTRAKVAKDANIPERKLRYAQEIKKASPAVFDAVRESKISLVEGKKLTSLPETAMGAALNAVLGGDDVRTAVRAAKKEEYNARIEISKPKPLEGTYRILYADPPWKYVGLNGADEHGPDHPPNKMM